MDRTCQAYARSVSSNAYTMCGKPAVWVRPITVAPYSQDLCDDHTLGTLTAPLERISGPHIHTVYCYDTTRGVATCHYPGAEAEYLKHNGDVLDDEELAEVLDAHRMRAALDEKAKWLEARREYDR